MYEDLKANSVLRCIVGKGGFGSVQAFDLNLNITATVS